MDTPTRSSPLFEQIYDILWDKILHGEIVPSQRLKDVEWAERLGVSRTPIREAMRKMQQEGILLPLNTGGCEVRPVVSADDLQALYRCRAAMESFAASEAANALDPKSAKQFGRTLELVIRNAADSLSQHNFDRAFGLNTEFHRAIIEASGNAYLIGLCGTLQKLIDFHRSTMLNLVRSGERSKEDYVRIMLGNMDEHRAILSAVVAKDPEAASKLMQEHLIKGIEDVDIEP